jgi:hypothetical protein
VLPAAASLHERTSAPSLRTNPASAAASLEPGRVDAAARAYSTRRVPPRAMRFLRSDLAPRSGDLVLARVATLGQHFRLHLPSGRSKNLWPGDEVVVAYADRYAPSQYEALVPADLGPCHLAASGGIAARVVASHAKLAKRPTELEPLGLVCERADGPALNLADFALPELRGERRELATLAVVGSAMDSGKTSALAHLARGMRRLGVRVGYAKLTGTAAGGDPWLLVDAGADPVIDFTDAGFASTSRIATHELERICEQLVLQLQQTGAEVALLEIADGLFQPETAALLASPRVRLLVDGMLYASVDALGAAHGAELLRAQGYRLLGLTGLVASAPLLVREAQAATDLPVYDRVDLADASVAAKLLAAAREARA